MERKQSTLQPSRWFVFVVGFGTAVVFGSLILALFSVATGGL